MSGVVLNVDIPGMKKVSAGKVREIFDLKDGKLLIVTTDRISAFDVVMSRGIPFKGTVLNGISTFWFNMIKNKVNSHLITSNLQDMPKVLHKYSDILDKRCMLVKSARMFPVECVVRGYLAGSGWKEYQKDGSVCGIKLPSGLSESAKLPEPIFTPATKALKGDHDENISFEKMGDIVGREMASKLRNNSIEIYNLAAEYAQTKGIILADTKFEWGWIDNDIALCDEVLTPDSSRFWPADLYEPGKSQPSFDKQYLRDYLETTGWEKSPPPPALPDEVVNETSHKYLDAYKRITGEELK